MQKCKTKWKTNTPPPPFLAVSPRQACSIVAHVRRQHVHTCTCVYNNNKKSNVRFCVYVLKRVQRSRQLQSRLCCRVCRCRCVYVTLVVNRQIYIFSFFLYIHCPVQTDTYVCVDRHTVSPVCARTYITYIPYFAVLCLYVHVYVQTPSLWTVHCGVCVCVISILHILAPAPWASPYAPLCGYTDRIDQNFHTTFFLLHRLFVYIPRGKYTHRLNNFLRVCSPGNM